jgi:AcrR family transcriptional regulator
VQPSNVDAPDGFAYTFHLEIVDGVTWLASQFIDSGETHAPNNSYNMETATMTAQASAKASSRLGKSDWIDAARKVLVKSGVSRIKVQVLAMQMRTTTGSFYWHFKNRAELLDALLEDWEQRTTTAFLRAYESSAADPHAQLEAVGRLWIVESVFDPSYDAAIRDWARTSKPVERLVRRLDEGRIEILKKIFRGFGFDDTRAFIRARIAYFHQVGYYALRIAETAKQREQYLPLYSEALTAGAPRSKR